MSEVERRIRRPAVAGRFYEADAMRCAEAAKKLCGVEEAGLVLPETLFGGIVPHAGWMCSGRVAGLTLSALRRHSRAVTVVLTGSVHTMAIPGPTLDTAGAWSTPVGEVEVDAGLREALSALAGFDALDMAHEYEHSLEVQLPLLATAFGPGVRIVPCLIPPVDEAAGWGRQIGRVLAEWGEPAIMVASSDLTHYGPNYRFTPEGVGEAGIEWAHGVNDVRLLELIEGMEADRIVPETRHRMNACGGGAIAATTAACAEMGAERGYVLEHTNSVRELAPLGYTETANSVGYAGVVFG